MNNKHILDLTLRLSQALDQNYDVVNMETVLSVISALEGATITKEQLEATRLAKYINQLRRRTNCENLARRAKSLLKRWREMVGIQHQQHNVNESSVSIATSSTSARPVTSTVTSSTVTSSYNMPVTDNAVSTSHLANPQFSQQHFQRHQFNKRIIKQNQSQPYSQPTSPLNLHEKSNPNEFVISVSNPAPATNLSKSSNTSVRKKKKLEKTLEKTLEDEKPNIKQQQQPTSFANLLTGLGYGSSSSFSSTRKSSREKSAISSKPLETFVIEHSSNSNSDIICLPSNTTLSSNITSATNVPPIIIDLQDTNSSMTSLVSKDVTNAVKQTSKKSKKEKKRKEMSRQSQPLQDCDDNNATTASYHRKRQPEMLSVDEKSHSACPTICNISEILSLSNSSMSSVFPSADGITKSIYNRGQCELPSSSGRMAKSDLTFAGKFRHTTSSSSTGCDVLNYNNDNINVNILSSNSPDQNKFSLFGGSGTTNSNDSTSNSRTSQFNISVNAIKHEISSNSKQNEEDTIIKHDINEKSMSNMSNKGNSLIDNVMSVTPTAAILAPHQQSIDLTAIDISSGQTIKQPKKRGRKKGSKGVDSVIAKETSLSSQMLMSSLSAAGKKVKTTKELYAEMENRKLRNVKVVVGTETPSSSSTTWTSHQLKTINSPRTPFCSDLAESDSCTMTSEPSRDSNGIPIKTVGKRDMPLDSNSNYSHHGSELKTDTCGEGTTSTTTATNSSTLALTLKLKHELQQLLKHFSPPPSVEEIERECFNDITPCTCVVEEIVLSDELCNIDGSEEKISDTDLSALNTIIKQDNNELQTELTTNVTDDKFFSESQGDPMVQSSPLIKPKKSIFDLDFDADEDPLNYIIADIVGKSTKENNMELIEESSKTTAMVESIVASQKDEYIHGASSHENDVTSAIDVPVLPSTDVAIIPSYKIKYDAECQAKHRFEVQTQKITKFHVDNLHNCFIPNVNGNWNHADVSTSSHSSVGKEESNDNSLERGIGDGYDVVPFFGSEVNEKIVKDLSHVKFTTKFKHKSWNSQNEILFHIPFMGVSRLSDSSQLKSNEPEFLNEEEKENMDNKLNVSNLNSFGFECTIKNCSENENVYAKDIKMLPMKKKKRRLKKTATSKCSTTKRLKLSVNGNQNNTGSQCDFENSGCIKLLSKNSVAHENLDIFTSDSDVDGNEQSDDDNDDVKDRLANVQCDGKEPDNYHHEVISHDLLDTSNEQNHIVLTIKKTPSKTNSPLNTLSNLSPVYSNIYENLNGVANKENRKTTCRLKQNQEIEVNGLKIEDDVDDLLSKDDNFFVRIKRIKRQKSSESSENFKLHKSLFYREEIYPFVKHGTQFYRESIFQISSCSSSCSAEEETIVKAPRVRSTSSSSSNSSLEKNNDHQYDDLTLNLQQDIISSEFKKRTINTSTSFTKCSPERVDFKSGFQQMETDNQILFLDSGDDDLPEENNLMLVSFNHIYSTCDGSNTYLNKEQLKKCSNERVNNLLKQRHQNCDDSNLNNNFNLIKYIDNKSSVSSNNNNSSIINYLDSSITLSGSCKNSRIQDDKGVNNKPFQEYQSGIRAVDEDVNDEQGNNCARLQEFKEWHEVLQLRSYNDELLTVLPYVVLD